MLREVANMLVTKRPVTLRGREAVLVHDLENGNYYKVLKGAVVCEYKIRNYEAALEKAKAARAVHEDEVIREILRSSRNG
jgi:hypothetical protein